MSKTDFFMVRHHTSAPLASQERVLLSAAADYGPATSPRCCVSLDS